jgi:hypothetical protein
MSSSATQGPARSSSKVVQQLAARPTGRRSETADWMPNEIHVSITLTERIANARRGYLAWLALETASITGKEPAIDRNADASWRAG